MDLLVQWVYKKGATPRAFFEKVVKHHDLYGSRDRLSVNGTVVSPHHATPTAGR
jgi:hypothetical protein